MPYVWILASVSIYLTTLMLNFFFHFSSLLWDNCCLPYLVKLLLFLVWEIWRGSLRVVVHLTESVCSMQVIATKWWFQLPSFPKCNLFPWNNGHTFHLPPRLNQLNNFPFLFSLFSSFLVFFFSARNSPLLVDTDSKSLDNPYTKVTFTYSLFSYSYLCSLC